MVLGEEEVFGLEVAVRDFVRVEVFDGFEDLKVVVRGFGLLEAFLLDDSLEELAAADVLHDEVDLGVGLEDLEELDDVGVAKLAEDVDFSLDASEIGFIFDAVLFKDFDGDILSSGPMKPLVDFAEGALAYGLL